MLYLTCTTIPSVDLAHYIVSHAKDWVSVDCGTNAFNQSITAVATSRWKDNIKEWTGMDFASSTRAAKNRTRWKGIVANSSVVPRRHSKVMG